MTEIKTYCDHCGKEISRIQGYTNIEIGIITYRVADLCANCVGELE